MIIRFYVCSRNLASGHPFISHIITRDYTDSLKNRLVPAPHFSRAWDVLPIRAFSSSNSEIKQNLMQKYGPVFMGFHFSVQILCVATFTILMSRGFDASPLMNFADNFVTVDSILSKGGYTRDSFGSCKGSIAASFALALVLNKVILPIRLSLDAIMVPLISQNLESRKDK